MNNQFEYAPAIYFSATDDGTLLEVNNFLCTNLGYEADELVGKKSEILLTVPSRIFQQTHFFPLLKLQGHAEEIFLTLMKSNKEQLPVLLNAVRTGINGDPVNFYSGIIVHNRKKFEDELIAARKSAESALSENTALIEAKSELQKRVEELDRQIYLVEKQNHELKQFNFVISHNLQEPVRKLMMFNDILQQKNKNEECVRLITKIESITAKMSEVLGDLQQYVWLQETLPDKKTNDLDELLDASAEKLKNEFPDVRLVLDKERLPHVDGDPEQLQLLFYHLLSNAIRFRKDDAQVHVHISATTLKLNQIRHIEGKYKYSDFLRIQIRDDGIGFDGAFKDRVFEIFRRLHDVSGRGVGLSLCKKIVDNHFGHIRIDSAVGVGTMVSVELPLNVVASDALV